MDGRVKYMTRQGVRGQLDFVLMFAIVLIGTSTKPRLPTFFAQSLIELTGSKLAPSYYMIATAALSLAALLVLRWHYRL